MPLVIRISFRFPLFSWILPLNDILPVAGLGYDVEHVLSWLLGDGTFFFAPQLSPSVSTIFALYDHLADVVGGRSATANPKNER